MAKKRRSLSQGVIDRRRSKADLNRGHSILNQVVAAAGYLGAGVSYATGNFFLGTGAIALAGYMSKGAGERDDAAKKFDGQADLLEAHRKGSVVPPAPTRSPNRLTKGMMTRRLKKAESAELGQSVASVMTGLGYGVSASGAVLATTGAGAVVGVPVALGGTAIASLGTRINEALSGQAKTYRSQAARMGKAFLNKRAANKSQSSTQPAGTPLRATNTGSADGGKITYQTKDGRSVTVTRAQAEQYRSRRK